VTRKCITINNREVRISLIYVHGDATTTKICDPGPTTNTIPPTTLYTTLPKCLLGFYLRKGHNIELNLLMKSIPHYTFSNVTIVNNRVHNLTTLSYLYIYICISHILLEVGFEKKF